MTLPVYNLSSAFGRVDRDGKVYVVPPWNMFLQQLVQPAPAVAAIIVGASPFSFTANSKGTLIISNGTISNISLIRGSDVINLTGQRIIPISINDIVSVTYSVAPTLQFLGA